MKKGKKLLSLLAVGILALGTACGKKEAKTSKLVEIVANGKKISKGDIKEADKTADYTNYSTAGIKSIYEYTVGTEIEAYGFKAEATGYTTTAKIVYEVAFDNDTNKVLGLNIVSEAETPAIGSALLKDTSFINQFKNLDIAGIQNIDNQTGPSAEITVEGMKLSLAKVANYYLTTIKQTAGQALFEDEQAAIKGFFANEVTLTDVTNSYTNIAAAEIQAIFEVKEGTTKVAYGFVVSTTGLSTGLVYATAIDVTEDNFLGLFAENNHESYGYDRLTNPAYLNQFKNLPIENIEADVDVIAGETLTTEGVKVSLTKIAAYYNANMK